MGFREYVTEAKIDYLEVLANSIGANTKMDQDMWDWFEKNLDDSGIYPGDALPEDYLEVMTDKQAKNLYKYLSKKYKDVLDSHMNEAKPNEKDITEAKDLSSYKEKVAEWVYENDNSAIRELMAKLVGDKRLTKVVDAINSIVYYENHNPIPDYTHGIYTLLNNMGRKKYGKDNWNSNIYNP